MSDETEDYGERVRKLIEQAEEQLEHYRRQNDDADRDDENSDPDSNFDEEEHRSKKVLEDLLDLKRKIESGDIGEGIEEEIKEAEGELEDLKPSSSVRKAG